MRRQLQRTMPLLLIAQDLTFSVSRAQGGDDQLYDQKILDAAWHTYESTLTAFRDGEMSDAEQLYLWSRRWMGAQTSLAEDIDGERTAITAHAARMKTAQEIGSSRKRTLRGAIHRNR